MERASGDEARPLSCCFRSRAHVAGVAKSLRERYPAARLVLVADAGKESQAAAIAKDVAWRLG
jgi:cysteine synthase